MPDVTTPTASGLLFGAFDPADWQLSLNAITSGTYDAIDKGSGQPMSLTHPQLSWAQGVNADGSPKYQRLYTPRLDADRASGRASLLTWMSFNLGHPEQNGLFNLPNILAGKHDPYIVQFGQDAAAYKYPFIVRLDPEMNGWWEGPFSESNADGTPQNGNSPGQFVQAWRHIVQLVRAQGASNVLWHWCPNPVDPRPSTTAPTNASRLASFYPGDDVVDLVGADLYNMGSPWLSFQQCIEGDGSNYGNTWATINAIAPTKPWLIGEIGSQDGPGDKAAWIVDMFNTIPARYPSIMGIAWFNWDTGPTGHFPLTEPAVALTAWGQGASGPRWLKAKQFDPTTLATMVGRFLFNVAQAQITSLTAQVAALQQQVSNAQGGVASESAQIQALQTQLAQVQGQLTQSQQGTVAAQAQVASLQQERTSVQQSLQGLLKFAGLTL